MSIGAIILTTNPETVNKVEVTEIGFKNPSSIVIDYDIDYLINRYSHASILESYVQKGVLHMTTIM
jgi:hypothetical protein